MAVVSILGCIVSIILCPKSKQDEKLSTANRFTKINSSIETSKYRVTKRDEEYPIGIIEEQPCMASEAAEFKQNPKNETQLTVENEVGNNVSATNFPKKQ